jgi:ketosteroid isomerase-like protein
MFTARLTRFLGLRQDEVTMRSFQRSRPIVAVAICVLTWGGLACGPVGAGEFSTAAATAQAATDVGPTTRFVLSCYDRAFVGDPKVYDDCFTEDFKATGPETRMVSTEADGSLRGRAYIQAYHDMNHGDAVAWGSVTMKTLWSVEANDKVIRLMRWVSSKPKGSYAGIDNIPPDLVVTIDGIFVDTIRDGKIAEQFFAYDTMRFITDIAQGDMKKVAAALVKMDAVMAAAKKAAAEGKSMPQAQQN